MYAFRNAHPAHRGYLLIGLSVRCIVTEQAIFDVCCENQDSGKILGSRSIGTPRKQSLHTHRPRIEERDLVYIDGMSFLHLIVDVLICIHELLRNLERVLEAFSSSCAREGRVHFSSGPSTVGMGTALCLEMAIRGIRKGANSAMLELWSHCPRRPVRTRTIFRNCVTGLVYADSVATPRVTTRCRPAQQAREPQRQYCREVQVRVQDE